MIPNDKQGEFISMEEFREQLDAIVEKVRNGNRVVITENGNTLAQLVPVPNSNSQTVKLPVSVKTKDEFEARMNELDTAYAEARLSANDSYFANVELIDMGPTDSSNLDSEIYRRFV